MQYDVGLRPGTSVSGYITSVNNALGQNSPWAAMPAHGAKFYSFAADLIGMLALMVEVAGSMSGPIELARLDPRHERGPLVWSELEHRPVSVLAVPDAHLAVRQACHLDAVAIAEAEAGLLPLGHCAAPDWAALG
jgi:hypothetical protein